MCSTQTGCDATVCDILGQVIVMLVEQSTYLKSFLLPTHRSGAGVPYILVWGGWEAGMPSRIRSLSWPSTAPTGLDRQLVPVHL